ncbi:ComEC/Rec2 family competence protein [uncultured Alistipes sp.]|uniref:ComEC/Rec2 family competence protein n=1 Tax=uncultured Alistipes sp. TaxID=538949 RepID=UPI0027D9AF29|nr:ComEC/Rec2 family competence protein [uncultured Alistipes sp.]
MKAATLLARLDRMPMLKAVVPFAAGIVAAGYLTAPLWFLAGAFLVAGVLALLLRSQLCAVAMLFVAGFGASQLHDTERSIPHNVYTTYQITVERIPSDRGRYSSSDAVVSAWRDPSDGTWRAARDRIILYADSLALPLPGERLYCRGTVRPFQGGAESYRRLMIRRGFAGTMWLSERAVLERQSAHSSSLHVGAAGRIGRLAMPTDAAAVCRAMVAGDKSGITPELRAAYSRSGLAHLLAVSGLHTGIVFALVNVLLWWMPLLRRGHLWRNLLAVVCIWTYVAAAGFPPSAIRAAVMCTFLQFALASASEYVALNSLATAAFGMLLWNPAWLGDISFQLSLVAVAAILAWGVPLCRTLRTRWRALNLMTDALAISLVAWLATAPLVSHTFGIVPLAGIAVNPVAILLGTVIVLAGAIWMLLPLAWLAPLFEFVLSTVTGWLNALARFTAALPCGSAEYTLGGWTTAGVYFFFALATAAAWSWGEKSSGEERLSRSVRKF